jgi:hypothetical protein
MHDAMLKRRDAPRHDRHINDAAVTERLAKFSSDRADTCAPLDRVFARLAKIDSTLTLIETPAPPNRFQRARTL